jgi:hypothetical protein
MLTEGQKIFLEKEEKSFWTGAFLVVIVVLGLMALLGILSHTYTVTEVEQKEVYLRNSETGQCFVQRRHSRSTNHFHWVECPCPEIQEP